MKNMLCIGGPWDGSLTNDIGTYLRVPNTPNPVADLSERLQIVTYVKIALKRRDGGVILVYEAEGTDAAMELWEFYLKNRKPDK